MPKTVKKLTISKKIALTILSLILGYNLIKLCVMLLSFSENELSCLVSIISAIIINLLITGFVAFLGFAFPTNKLLPKTYYKLKNKEKLKSIYSILGVNFFRHFLLFTFYKKKNNQKYFNGTKSGIKKFDYNTRQSEFGHLTAFILIEIIAVIFLSKNLSSIFLWIQPINIFLNFYPIILQRFHRIKTENILASINQNN